MSKYDLYLKEIKNYLSNGPKLSLEINAFLVKKFNITEVNARKILSNLIKKKEIYFCENITFDSGSRLIYISNNQNKFLNSTKKYKPYLYYLINLLDNFKYLTFIDVYKISACTLNKKSKNRRFEDVVKEINVFRDFIIIDNMLFLNSLNDEEKKKKAYVEQKNDNKCYRILPALIHSQTKMNLICNKKILYRSKLVKYPQMNGFYFDAIAQSKSLKDDKDCFFFYDIVLTRGINLQYIDSLKERIENTTKTNKTPVKGIGVIIYSHTEKIFLDYAHQMGILTINISDLFGRKIENILNCISLIEETIDSEDKSLLIKDTLEELKETGQDENLGNIKGELFEYIVSSIVSKIYNGTGFTVKRKKEFAFKVGEVIHKRELDLLVFDSERDETILIECKSSKNKIPLGAYHKDTKTITKDSVKYFYEAYSKYVENNKDKNNKFVFFAANGFETSAIDFMNREMFKKIKSDKMNVYYDLNIVKEHLIDKYPTIKLDCEIWEKYFIKDK